MRARTIVMASLLAGSLAALTAGTGVADGTFTPALGTEASQVDLSTVKGAVEYGQGWAVPLRAQQPAWYTDALAAEVDAANGAPVAAPPQAPLPSEIGIRPGAWMIEPAGCTMNFIFKKSSAFAIGTAGHCTNRLGQEVVLLTVAPGGTNPVLVEVGTVLARQNGGIGNDFALVSIRPELAGWVDPTTAVIGGPCGAYTGSGPETVAHYGHGLVNRDGRDPEGRCGPQVHRHGLRLGGGRDLR